MPVFAGTAALLSVLAAGCASVEYSSPGKLAGVAVKGSPNAAAGQHVVITTSGYNMFWSIPLFSGDLRWDGAKRDIRGGTAFFCDQVGFDELQTALLKIAESRNCELADVSFNDNDGFYADVSWGGLVGMFFGSSQMGVSAILVPRAADAKQGGGK